MQVNAVGLLWWGQNESLLSEVSALPRMKAELEALRRRHASALELMGERDEQVRCTVLYCRPTGRKDRPKGD